MSNDIAPWNEQPTIDADNEEFNAACRYAARAGLLKFNISFLIGLFWNWRYGFEPEDAFR